MAFQKGHPKLGGRQKGTPNSKASEQLERFQEVYGKDFITAYLEHMKSNVKDKTDLLKALLPYMAFRQPQDLNFTGDVESVTEEIMNQSEEQYTRELEIKSERSKS